MNIFNEYLQNLREKKILHQMFLYFFLIIFYFPFFFFGCTHGIWKFPGQGSNSRGNCDLQHSYKNARSLTHCPGLRIKPVLPQRKGQMINPYTTAGIPRHHFLFFYFFIFILIFRATPVAYGSSQARG